MKERRPVCIGPYLKSLYGTALFNVLALLLLFLMLLPIFSTPCGLSVALPGVVSSETFTAKRFVVTILKDNTFWMGSTQVTLDGFKQLLAHQRLRGSDVLIKADQRANIGVLVGVIDILRQSGANVINIATNE